MIIIIIMLVKRSRAGRPVSCWIKGAAGSAFLAILVLLMSHPGAPEVEFYPRVLSILGLDAVPLSQIMEATETAAFKKLDSPMLRISMDSQKTKQQPQPQPHHSQLQRESPTTTTSNSDVSTKNSTIPLTLATTKTQTHGSS
jgi:hypothetical protein